MDVRELIIELLECDLDAEASLQIVTDEGLYDTDEFEIDEAGVLNSPGYVNLSFEAKYMSLVNTEYLQELKDQIEELEGQLNE